VIWDNHLLELNSYKTIRILDPADFLIILRDEGRN